MDNHNQHHDVEESDFQEFWYNFREWWSKWGNAVMTIVAVICIAIAIYLIIQTKTMQSHESAWNDLANSASPQALQQVAAEHSNLTVQILANLRGADLYLANAASPNQPNTNQATTAPTTEAQSTTQPSAQPKLSRKEQLKRAKKMYGNVLELAKKPLYKLNALMGLASVAEDNSNWDLAAKYYKQVSTLAKQNKFANFANSAKSRLKNLSELKRPVTFAPTPTAPAPATTPTVAPTTKPSTQPTSAQ